MVQSMKARLEYDPTDESKIASDYSPKARSLRTTY